MSQEQVVVRRPSFQAAGYNQDDILKLIDRLEELADKPQALLGRAWGMDLEEFHMLTNKIRASLPDEVRKASRVANDSEKIVRDAKQEAEATVAGARKEADRIIEEAREVAAKLIDTSEISRLAKNQAQEIMAHAEAQSREVKRGADEYAREVLTAVENHLGKVLSSVQKGREQLDARVEAQHADDPILPTHERCNR